MLQPHQSRVVEERDQLEGRLIKLTAFFTSQMFKTLPGDEQDRLQRQASVMKEYLKILDERIAAWG